LSSDDRTLSSIEAFKRFKEYKMATTPTSVDDNQQGVVKETVDRVVAAVQSKSLRIKVILVIAAGIASLAFQPLGVIGAGLITLLATEVKS
jgi:hypothetical protein